MRSQHPEAVTESRLWARSGSGQPSRGWPIMVSLSKWGNQDETHSSGRELLIHEKVPGDDARKRRLDRERFCQSFANLSVAKSAKRELRAYPHRCICSV